MTELIIAVALWCGNPYGTIYGQKNDYRLSNPEIQSCRARLMKCIGPAHQDFSKIWKCFDGEKR